MLTVHLLGHAHVTHNGRPVPLSAKAVALITYLALEKLPQHRERLADLLWNTAEARKNLRVELARIRSAGLGIFPPSRQLLYLEHVTTDLEVWQARLNGEMDQAELTTWLAMLRGLPLSGLEDLGSPAFQEWIDQQRWALNEQIEQLLHRAYRRFERDGKTWATRAVAARAEALGFEHPGERLGTEGAPQAPSPQPAFSAPAGPLHFEHLGKERALQELLARAAQEPQLAVLHGPVGSGKSYLAEYVLGRSRSLTVRISNSRMSRLVLATLAQALLPVSEPSAAETLRGVLLSPGSLEEDTVKVAMALATVAQPVVILLDHAHNAPIELASLFEFLLQTPAAGARALVLLSRTPPAQAALCRALLRRFGPQQCLCLEMTPLSISLVERALEAQGLRQGEPLHARAAEVLQRSEGNVLHLRNLLEQPAGPPEEPGGRLPAAVRESYAGEIDGWPVPLRQALSSLSVIHGDFDLKLAETALDAARHGVPALPLLREALERGALIEAEPPAALLLPSFRPVVTSLPAEPRYRFRAEGLRVTLAARQSHAERQEVRRRLAAALEATEPGLALYYAERAGVGPDTERLRRAYHMHLPAGSPLLHLDEAMLTPPCPQVAEPQRTRASGSDSVNWQGYLLSWQQGGWLNVVSQGRYGHPHTLHLHLPIAALLRGKTAPIDLRLVWRLDVYRCGHELGPTQVPFPLRLTVLGSDQAQVLTPQVLGGYTEAGLEHRVHTDVALGRWMEQRLTLAPGAENAACLELAVRALDVALTVAELRVNGQSLLPLASTPERLYPPRSWAEGTPALQAQGSPPWPQWA
ncbi:AAA family ATPase [Deinococcus sp. YIM 77859]|uniref:AAA family ATPase n=1 Tax=Deinococcus sp. YIM 77859 TaxID=1540221 RepID=UPI00068AB649|nr:AAA family ATPase [Deinococcus sp. YIM 77859]